MGRRRIKEEKYLDPKKRKLKVKNCIRELRYLNEMSQSDLAEAVGLSRVAISAIELGDSLPDIEHCYRFAWVFGVSVGTIFYVEGLSDRLDSSGE